jgi:predicted secreted Zn-dependent protease
MFMCVLKYIAQQLPGALIALAVSWFFADRYFTKQRAIDRNKEEQEVKLSYNKLVNAFFKHYGKRPKTAPVYLRDAMTELEMRLKVYRPEFNAAELQKKAGEQAAKVIKENPGEFEDDK